MEQHSIFRLASKYMHHDMIEKYTEFPDFPHCRTRLLQIFLNRGEAETDRNHHLYALVVSILQVGLDTHDGVENGTDPADFHKTRGQQLKVLAGDYCSSRFYHLLSEAGQIDMVQRMSAATCEVNRLKVNLYMKMRQWKLSAEEYLLQTVNIKSQLFLSFSHLMEGMYRKHWPRVLRAFTRCEVLANEWDRVNRTEMLRESWAYWYLLDVADPEEKKPPEKRRLDAGADRDNVGQVPPESHVAANAGNTVPGHIRTYRDVPRRRN